MIKKISLFLLAFTISFAKAQNGYKIDVTIKQFAKKTIYLGYYFGKTFPIKDSVKLNAQGFGSFLGKTKLPGGIYLIGFPSKTKYFEVLIDKIQHFSIIADTSGLSSSVVIKNNTEGITFQNYQKYMEQKGKELSNIKDNSPSSESLRKKLNGEVTAYRNKISAANPSGLLPTIFKVIEMPSVPPANLHPGGKYDSTYAWYFYKSNYWKGVDFKDERIIRTPKEVFEVKFDNYFKNIVYPISDSIIKEVDKILLASMPNKDMFKYLTSKLIERYVNPEYMGQDAVYVHLFEKYVATGMTDWFDEKQKKFLFDRGYSLMANLIGDKAAPLELQDTMGKPVNLYNIEATYTVICFWDATCGHCKEVVPKLDSIFTTKWIKNNVKLLGVMTDGGLDNWKKYIAENKFTSWIHAYQPEAMRKAESNAGKANFRQLYDIQNTPKLYLLDKEKRIIAKQLTFDQMDDVLTKRLNSN